MNILIGKTKGEILKDFKNALDINNHSEFERLVRYLEHPKIHLHMKGKHWILVWAIPFLLIGISAITALIWEMSNGGFPWIYEGFVGFIGKFVNILQASFMLCGCIFLIWLPLNRMSYHYDWDW